MGKWVGLPESEYPAKVNNAITRAVEQFQKSGCLQDLLCHELGKVGWAVLPIKAQNGPNASSKSSVK